MCQCKGVEAMKKIVLLCAAGMSTSLLVTKMRKAAEEAGFKCDIDAYPVAKAPEVGADADVVLLGPQVRFNLAKVQEQCPGIPVESIDMAAYGMMDGKKVISRVMELVKE